MYPELFWFPSVTWSSQLCRLGGTGPVAVRKVQAARRAEPQGSGVPGGWWYHLLLTPLVLKQRCSRLRHLVWLFTTTANVSTDRAANNITVFLSSDWTCRRLRGDHHLLGQPRGREEGGGQRTSAGRHSLSALQICSPKAAVLSQFSTPSRPFPGR